MVVEEKPISVGVRLSPSVKQRLDVEASRRGVFIYELLKDAIDHYMNEPKAGPHVPGKLQPWMKELAEVLASGDRDAINHVTGAIRFARGRMQSVDGPGQG